MDSHEVWAVVRRFFVEVKVLTSGLVRQASSRTLLPDTSPLDLVARCYAAPRGYCTLALVRVFGPLPDPTEQVLDLSVPR